MEKLTIKELAPYLPYGLKGILIHCLKDDFLESDDWVDDIEIFSKGTIWTYAGYADEDLLVPLGDGDFSGFLIRYGNSYTSVGNSVKPILRPLSDLTKEIEHNGEKFIPCYKFNFVLESYKNGIAYSRVMHGEVVNGKQVSSLSDIDQHTFDDNGHRKIWSLDYHSFCLLLEHHFDVFRLIEKGLAIDINTLN